MNHKRTITALTAALMLSAALPAAAQSVPVIDDNSNHIKGNTDKIKGYLDEIRQFLGADKRDKTVKGSGLETDVADFKKIESQAKELTSGQWSNSERPSKPTMAKMPPPAACATRRAASRWLKEGRRATKRTCRRPATTRAT